MSGSNALAAAKRRRGGSQELNKIPPPGSRGLQKGAQQSQQSQTSVNPLQLVMINHQRLNSIQSELPKAIDNLGESLNALSSNCDFLHENFKSLQSELNTLKTSKAGNTFNPDLENKLNKLEVDLSESHKIVLKNQSFSMDLSSQLMKLKEDYNTLSANVKKIDILESNLSKSQIIFNEQLSKIDRQSQKMIDELSFKLKDVSELLQALLSNKHNDNMNQSVNQDITEDSNPVANQDQAISELLSQDVNQDVDETVSENTLENTN